MLLISRLISNKRALIGLFLIFLGIIVLIDEYLKTGWLTLLMIPSFGLLCLCSGIWLRKFGLVIAGNVIVGLGTGLFLVFNQEYFLPWQAAIGFSLVISGFSFVMITIFSKYYDEQIAWWAIIPGGVITGVGLCFINNRLGIVDFSFYISIGLGLAFLIWGIYEKLLGLLIPGCLLLGIGPGVFEAWGGSKEVNGLVRTGVMLVWFAFGWGLIILLSKVIKDRFIWWPLIPGGVLAMVGWGLYLGGDAKNAVGFIGNSGSIAIIIFGIYLILLRNGIRR
jgi:hypothetical protein